MPATGGALAERAATCGNNHNLGDEHLVFYIGDNAEAAILKLGQFRNHPLKWEGRN